MQPSEEMKVSSKSELLDSLKMYLTNRKRLQPIIGLGSIVECVKVGAWSREVLYLCEVCQRRLGKADIRNHIFGSLHRYNYIKTWHPHTLAEWKDNSDLSKLAWPLMEIAKTIEEREGAGDVQLLEVEDAVFQRMATLNENDAVTFLRDCQAEGRAESRFDQLDQLDPSPRTVLPARKRAAAPCMETEGWYTQLDSCSSLSVYTGSKPLIGLFRVVECRSDTGQTCVFLCHCCRIRSNKRDIIGHLTSSSHLNNYLMETYSGQVGVLLTDDDDHSEFLQSLARKVEQEEGRGELEVINVPESLCMQLTGKSYHWCIKMLCSRGTQPSHQSKRISFQEKHAVKLSKWAENTTRKRKKRTETNTVFKVSLPLKTGPLLLERMSFNEDDFPAVQSPASGDSPLLETLAKDNEMDCDAGSFEISYTEHNSTTLPQLDLFSEDAETRQYMEAERNYAVAQYQEVDGYFPNNEYVCQLAEKTVTNYQNIYQENNTTRQYGSQETSHMTHYYEKDLTDQRPQNVSWSHAVSPTQDWSSYTLSHRQEGVYSQQWYSSASQKRIESNQKVSRDESALQIYQQLPENQYVASNYNSYWTGHVGNHSSSAEVAPDYGDNVACPDIQIDYRGLYNPNYYHEPIWDAPCPHNNNTTSGSGGDLSQSSTFIPSVQSKCYGSYYD